MRVRHNEVHLYWNDLLSPQQICMLHVLSVILQRVALKVHRSDDLNLETVLDMVGSIHAFKKVGKYRKKINNINS